jgi:hypothetical protein
MNIERIFSQDNLTDKFGIPLEINKSYIIGLKFKGRIEQDIDKLLALYKGVYLCQHAYEYYFIFKLLDFYGRYGDLNLPNNRLKLRILTPENVDFVENKVQNNISNGRLIINELKKCWQKEETKTLREWIYDEPYLCLTVKVGGAGSTVCCMGPGININYEDTIFLHPFAETKEYKILENNYTYPLPKHILSYQETTEHKVIHAQCNQVNNSGNYYFIEFEGDTYNQLVNQIPIITNPRELENGLYTYVILSIGTSEPELYLFKINSIFELGTKHPELVEKIALASNQDINTFHIYYAGEIEVKDNQILFNFNSGGFMFGLVSVKDLVEGIPLMIGKLKMIFDPKYDITYANKTLIDRRNIAFTQEELDNFKNKGAIIKEFDYEDECMEYQNEYYMDKYNVGGKRVLIVKGKKYNKKRRQTNKKRKRFSNKKRKRFSNKKRRRFSNKIRRRFSNKIRRKF